MPNYKLVETIMSEEDELQDYDSTQSFLCTDGNALIQGGVYVITVIPPGYIQISTLHMISLFCVKSR